MIRQSPERAAESEAIARATREFLSSGKRIQYIPFGTLAKREVTHTQQRRAFQPTDPKIAERGLAEYKMHLPNGV